MYRYQSIDDPDRQLRLLRKLGSKEPAANAAGSLEHLFLSVATDEAEIGVIRGWFIPENAEFQILMLLVLPEWRSAALLQEMIAELLAQARRRYHSKLFFWRYTVGAGRTDLIERLAQGIPGATAHAEPSYHRYHVHLPGFRTRAEYYPDEYLARRGYRILRASELTSEMKTRLMDQIRSADERDELKGLQPFVEEFDEDTSFFLQEQESDLLCGWVICRLMDPTALEVRRWYAFPSRRAKMAGACLIGRWIDYVSTRYEDIEFIVRADNRTMLQFCRRYFKEALRELYVGKTLRIEIENKENLPGKNTDN